MARGASVIHTYDGLDALPRSLRIYGASDYATMEPKHGKKEPDFTEHGIWGVDRVGDLWAVDWWSKQCETDVGIAAFIRLVAQWKPIKWFNEGGLIDKAIGPAIRSSMQHSQKFVSVESLPSLDDKAIKLQAFHARATALTVHLPVRRKWAEDLIDQLVKFPGGRWDDKADVCGLIGRGVDQMVDARLPSHESRPLLVPFTEAWLTYNDRNEKPKVRYF
jgi:predicted phage terminase large subunit-like protein